MYFNKKNVLDVLSGLKNRSIKTFFVLVATIFFSGQSQALNVLFGPFGDANIDGDQYTWPTGAEPWAGYYAWTGSYDDPQDLPAMSFANGGTITFTAALASPGATELRFKFEKLPFPDTDPSFYTSWVPINSTIEQSYTVNVPAQLANNTYASFLLYLGDRDKSVILKNFVVTATLNDSECQSSLNSGVLKIEAECYTQALGDVDVENTTDIGGGQNVGWIDAFDSMIYSVNIPSSGNYQLSYRTASPTGSALGFDVSIENQLVDTFSVPATGGWQTWQTETGRVIYLDSGQQSIQLNALDTGMNINWFALTQTSAPVDAAPADNNDSGDRQPIDSSKWFHQTILPNGWGWFNNEKQHYTDELENSYVSDGTLKIVAKKESYTDQGVTKQYTSARLNSKFAFKYGKVEFRAKMPSGYGTWPAVWMLNRNINETGNYWGSQGYASTSWPACGEIDILEHWGRDPGYAQSAMHNGHSSGGTVHHGGRYINSIFSQFHTYSMDWNASRIIFKIDGIEHYTYNPYSFPGFKNADTWPYDDHFFFLLNIAIEENITSGFTQSQMEVDWIRVYHHQTNELLWSDEFNGVQVDTDNDGVFDDDDAFPNDPTETADSDNDGVGDNADDFPNDNSETVDTDSDGVGDNADAFPNDASETTDTDSDGVGDNADAFPNDASETADSDNDGIGDNADQDSNPSNPIYTESQIISFSNNPYAIRNGQLLLDIDYDVSSGDNELTGVGFRIHFDSTKFQFLATNNLLLAGNIASGSQSEADTDNFDNNPITDRYINVAWASIYADWPGLELPTRLLTVAFDVDSQALNTIDYSSVGFSNTSSASGFNFTSNTDEIKIMPASWDFDSNDEADALTDGLLFLRHSFKLSGSSLTDNAMASNSLSSTAQVESLLNAASNFTDIDGDGQVDALSDGLLLLRYLFNLRGDSLTRNLISPNAIRTTHSEIETYIHGHMPEQTIEIVDEIAPQITLNGDSTLPLALDVSYEELGAIATDNRDSDVVVTVSGAVGNSVGTYDITYTATDAAGNSSSVTRTVIVDVAPTMSSFELLTTNNPSLNEDINLDMDGNTFSGRVSQNISVSDLYASFTHNGATVSVADVEQTSASTANDFTALVEYKVSKANGVSKTYTVDLTKFTGLPIVNIQTDGNLPIESKDDYITGTVTIDGGRGFEDLSSTFMEIRGRGNSTWQFPKKPYQMKLDSKEKFLDMPKQKKWIFLAEYSDKSLLRNTLAFELGYLSTLDWTPKSEFAEVFINGEYNGTYNVAEKVEEKSARVDIGDEGFLLEKDTNVQDRVDPDDVYFNTIAYQGENVIVIKDPGIDRLDANDFAFEQDSRFIYIRDHINAFEAALFGDDFKDPVIGYASYIDIDSFIDWFLINAIAKNVDSRNWSSIYFTHIPGEKIKMGPLWDFDLGFGNLDYSDAQYVEGWHVRYNAWISRLLEDSAFVTQLQGRFTNHYLANKQYILDKIDEKAELLKWSQQENFNKWQILGVQVWPNRIDRVFDTFDEEVTSLKQWYEDRMDWIEQNIGSI